MKREQKMKDDIRAIKDFLRFSLSIDSELPDSIDELNWELLYKFAQEQAIVGVLFEGIKRLTASDPHPVSQLLAKWLMVDNAIESQNIHMNARVEEVVGLFRRNGFDCCLLKGQGNARMYPNPLSRTPGDIDLWVSGCHQEVVDFCRRLNPHTVISYHHAQQPYKDVELEIHFHPNYAGNYFYNKRLQKYFDHCKAEEMGNTAYLPNGGVAVPVPTDSFNRIFQLSHIMKHFLYEGVGMRQVIDYYYLLKRTVSDEQKKNEAMLMKQLNLYKFATALMFVLHDFLGLEETYLTVPPSEKEGGILLDAILKGGNFGRADKNFSVKGKSRAGLYLTYVRRSMQFALHYPAEVVWGRPFVPLWRRWEALFE